LRRRAVSRLALVLCAAVLAVAVAGCKNSLQILPDNGDVGWFSKPVDIFHKPDGRCATPAAPRPAAAAAAPAPPPDRPVGSLAGDLARAPMPAATPAFADQGPGAPPVLGGVALGMSECEVVRRAGPPGTVNIGVGDRGSRKVVLTYLSGPWPGIYTFDSGRLKVVDRAPEQPSPVQESPKTKKAKKRPAKPKAATRETERFYVR
jgi:hypothetical protein